MEVSREFCVVVVANMFYNSIYLVCFSFLNSKVLSSPLAAHGDLNLSGSALIDCSDGPLLRRIIIAKIPFRCLEDTDNDVSNFKTDFNSILENAPEEEIIIVENVECSNPKRCGINVEASISDVCQPDFMFDPTLGECIPRSRRECKEGYSYDSELERCVSNKQRLPVQDDKSLRLSSHKCPSGYVYSPEIDRCQAIVRPPVQGRPPVASLIKDQPEVSTRVFQEIVGKKKCAENMVYVAEIDICVPYEKPPQSKMLSRKPNNEEIEQKNKRSIQSSTKLHHSTNPSTSTSSELHSSTNPSTSTVSELHHSSGQIKKEKCGVGQVYSSEIDHCVDDNLESSVEVLE